MNLWIKGLRELSPATAIASGFLFVSIIGHEVFIRSGIQTNSEEEFLLNILNWGLFLGVLSITAGISAEAVSIDKKGRTSLLEQLPISRIKIYISQTIVALGLCTIIWIIYFLGIRSESVQKVGALVFLSFGLANVLAIFMPKSVHAASSTVTICLAATVICMNLLVQHLVTPFIMNTSVIVTAVCLLCVSFTIIKTGFISKFF